MILWLNNHEAVLTLFLVAATTVATIGLLCVTWRYVELTRKLVDENVAMRKIQTDPLIIIDFCGREHGYSAYCLVFKNIGRSAAYNIKAVFTVEKGEDGHAVYIQNLNSSGIVDHGIHFLQPEREYVVKIGIKSDYRELFGLTIGVSLEYFDEQNNSMPKYYSINFDYLKGVLSSTI